MSRPLTLHLVRHGETLFNRRGLVQGWVDSPLTEPGRRQAATAGLELAARQLLGIYSSTSERAEDTALAIAAHHPHLTVERLKGLKEMYFGELEARPGPEFEDGRDVPIFFAEMFAAQGTGVAGGETGAAFVDRVTASLSRIRAGHPDGGEVVAVSHGVTINMILALAGWTQPGPLENGSISTVRFGAARAEVVAVGGLTLPARL